MSRSGCAVWGDGGGDRDCGKELTVILAKNLPLSLTCYEYTIIVFTDYVFSFNLKKQPQQELEIMRRACFGNTRSGHSRKTRA